jgi:hypothetical protein
VTIILLVFPALYIARRTRAYQPAMHAGSVALIVIAAACVLDRAFGVDLGLDPWVEAVLLWPRSLLLVAALYVGAVALYYFDKSRDALIPVVGAEQADRQSPRAAMAEEVLP